MYSLRTRSFYAWTGLVALDVRSLVRTQRRGSSLRRDGAIPLTAKTSPGHLSIETPVEPPVPARRQSRGVLHARPHNFRMRPAEVLEEQVALKVEPFLREYLGLGLGWLISIIDPELFLPFG